VLAFGGAVAFCMVKILFTAEGGYSFGPALVKVTFDALKSTIAPPDIVGQPVTTPLPGGGGAFPNVIQGDQDIFKISPSLIVNLTKGVAARGDSACLCRQEYRFGHDIFFRCDFHQVTHVRRFQ